MFCRNCANELDSNAAFCVKCGVKAGDGNRYCPNCGAETAENAAVCIKCGVELKKAAASGEQKSKMAAGLLGIFLGGLGIHNFYLGNTGRGVIQIVVTLLTCGVGSVWGLVEGIMILTGAIKTDGKGNPLKE